jgi:hypothetical protein
LWILKTPEEQKQALWLLACTMLPFVFPVPNSSQGTQRILEFFDHRTHQHTFVLGPRLPEALPQHSGFLLEASHRILSTTIIIRVWPDHVQFLDDKTGPRGEWLVTLRTQEGETDVESWN